MMLLLASLAAVIVLVLPRYGLWPLLAQQRRQRRREQAEDTLKHLLDHESRGRTASFSSIAGTLRVGDSALMTLLTQMENQGLLEARDQEFRLTNDGKRLAVHVVRAHRLWERYLADEARLPIKRVHSEAERREHGVSALDLDRLEAQLGHPTQDPHGDPIPTREGYIAPLTGRPLTDWPVGTTGRVIHLEDEPPLSFAQIVAEGLQVGQVVRVVDASASRIVLSDGRREYRLAPAVAANVLVMAEPHDVFVAQDLIPLSTLDDRAEADVVSLNEACQGFTRRRLLDLGFTPGARLRADLTTFAGDPRAYRIRGTLVALRRDQAAHILVKRAS